MAYQSESLREEHELAQFCCGKPELDEWLKEHARHARAMRTASTFVWAEGLRVVGYYSLCGHRVAREELPSRIARGGPSDVPAVLLAKLALDESLKGRRLGEELLVDAMERVVRATELVAARLVVVDGLDAEAVTFYEKYGFVRTAAESLRLVKKVSDIEREFAQA